MLKGLTTNRILFEKKSVFLRGLTEPKWNQNSVIKTKPEIAREHVHSKRFRARVNKTTGFQHFQHAEHR